MEISELKNGCVYVCMKGVIKQMFMYTNTAKDDEHAYSLLIEYTPDAKYPYVYCGSVGPKLTLEDLRTADLEEIADFFAEAQKNDYAYNRQNKKWTSAVDADVVVTPKHNANYFSKFKSLEKGNAYEFIILDDRENGHVGIIGEVDAVTEDTVKLAAWAYSSEPEIIRAASDIIVVEVSELQPEKWYKFMSCRSRSLRDTIKHMGVTIEDIGNDTQVMKTEQKDDLSEELKLVEHIFAKRITEDASEGRTTIVKKSDRLFVFPCPENAKLVQQEAYCEVTDIVKMMVNDFDNLHTVFGRNNVMEFTDYEWSVSTIHDMNRISAEETVTDTVDNGVVTEVNEPVKQQTINDFDGLNPHLFTNAIEAADTIDAGDDSQYIIVVPISADKAEVTLTDDPHSILHSRHLIDKEVIVYGPVKNNYFANISDAFRHYTLV